MKKLLSSLVYWLTIKPRIIRLQKLLPDAKIHPVGSRYVCHPPVMNTDIDLLVLELTENFCWVKLLNAGYKKTTDIDKYIGGGNFTTWRRGKVNLIVSVDLEFVEGFQTGTHICKQFNIRDKDQRILIHASFRKNEYFPASLKEAKVSEQIQTLLANFNNGPHGNTLHKVYRAQQGLVL